MRWPAKLKIRNQRDALIGIVVVTGLIGVLLYVAPNGVERRVVEHHSVVLDVLPVEVAPSRITIQANGVARPVSEIPLIAEVNGRVLSVAEGFVSGAVAGPDVALATINPEPYELALAQRKNEVSAASLHLAETRARSVVAKRTSGKRATDYARMVPHLAEAQTRLEAAKAALRSASVELSRTEIRAPFTGRLRDIQVKAGQYVTAGQLLGYLYTPNNIEVRLPVRDQWLSFIDLPHDGTAPDKPVSVTLKADFAGVSRTWKGEIIRREGGLDKNQMVALVARVIQTEGQMPLEPGVWLDASIEGSELSGVAVLPETVVGRDNRVWLVNKEQRLERRNISVLYRDDQQVYVSTGLASGDQVVLAGDIRMMEGTEVKVRQPWLSDISEAGATIQATP
jgi:membrane fusion protein, multidrug efflux system